MDTPLDQLLKPLVRLCLLEGVGFAQVRNILKKVYVQQARQELQRRGTRVTTAALSVLCGINQVAVREVMDSEEAPPLGHPTVIDQIMLQWTRGQWPKTLAYKGRSQSFVGLVKSCHLTGVSPLSVLREMKERGLVAHVDDQVTCLADAGSQKAADPAIRSHLIGAVADHAQVAIDNFYKLGSNRLEQSLTCDALTERSIEEVHALARAWWFKGSQDLAHELTLLDAQDALHPKSQHHRMRLGIYFYSEPLNPAEGQ